MKYEQVIDGEWFKLDGKQLKQMCCSCCLVHKWQYRVNPDNTLSIKVEVDYKATRAARKRYGKEVKNASSK